MDFHCQGVLTSYEKTVMYRPFVTLWPYCDTAGDCVPGSEFEVGT
ncbi:Uncharacterised protein [Mycobacterium tuberculosis]|nr:Uncharacterised protein [Mycobacterium tuberculosis]